MEMFASAAKTLVSLLLLACLAPAQVTTAAISGMVTDATGAMIPGSTISLRRIETGSSRTTVSDSLGRYLAANLEPGIYDVEAVKAGFDSEVRSGIRLNVGADIHLDFSLKVSAVHEKVVVSGDALVIDTADTSIGHVVERPEMEGLPLNGRDYTQLTLLAPGVVDLTTFAGSSFFGLTRRIAVAGTRPSSGGVYLIDGTNVMSFFNDNAGNPGIGTALGAEAIQEFRLETSTFSPEYARSGTSVINAISRTGANQVHASAFEFFRNSALDARNYFDGSRIPSFQRSQFGASLGGPIVQDRAFYFGSYEGLRESLGETEIGGSPTPLARQGILPTGNVEVNPAIVPILDLFPPPNGPDLGDGVGLLITTAHRNTHEDYFSARFDQRLSAKHSIFGRVIVDNGRMSDPYPLAGSYVPFYQSSLGRNRYVTLQQASIFSANTVNAARVSFNRNNSSGDTATTSTALNLIPGLTDRAPGAVAVGGVGYVGPDPIIPYALILNTWTFADDLSLVRGAHFLKTGVEWQKIQDPYRADLYSGGFLDFNTLPDFLTGNPFTFLAPLPNKLNTRRTWNENLVGLYAWDSWRVTKNLTLNFGARYEFITNPTESHGRFSTLVKLTDTAVTHQPHVFARNPSLKNIAPRFGFAWHAAGNGKTSARGGWGLYFQQYMPRDYAQYGFNPPETELGIGIFPGFPISPSTLFGLPPSISLVTGYDVKATPYVMEYNLNLQRELAPELMVEIGAVFSLGRKLLGAYELQPAATRRHPPRWNPDSNSLGNPAQPVFLDSAVFLPPSHLELQFADRNPREEIHEHLPAIRGIHLVPLAGYTVKRVQRGRMERFR